MAVNIGQSAPISRELPFSRTPSHLHRQGLPLFFDVISSSAFLHGNAGPVSDLNCGLWAVVGDSSEMGMWMIGGPLEVRVGMIKRG